MPNGFMNGNIVSMPCLVSSGMSSFERYIRIEAEPERITGFVNSSSIDDSSQNDHEPARKASVKAVIVEFSEADVRLLFSGQDVHPSNPAPVSVDWLGRNARVVTKE